ncbi:prolyl 3-hydroxylase /prolyl 3,4-dihydroxylase [Pancytospora epiphaga]|nr:prolyl 3-hydroxylase /prolyl 3,4-dihydroxylase [Pancytospora epiphaga]
MIMNEYQAPFYHAVIDDFLPDSQFEALYEIYTAQEFKEIHTDLYCFLQTGELAHIDGMEFFKEKLDGVFSKHCSLEKRYYNMFGSYFREGDGLLVHDDLVGNRVFAFAFYFEDFDSGEFLIYEKDCVTLSKKVPVRKNRLLIFKVGEYSFHEVGTSTCNGRMAVAGWFNIENMPLPVSMTKSSLYIPNNIRYYELSVSPPGPGEMQIIPFEDANTPVLLRMPTGPYIYRRYTRIEQEVLYVPRFDGYELIHADCIQMDSSDYILCNDAINDILDEIMDVFIFSDGLEEVSSLILYVGKTGNKSFSLDAVPGHMIIGPREGHALCITRSNRSAEFKHFIYKKVCLTCEMHEN